MALNLEYQNQLYIKIYRTGFHAAIKIYILKLERCWKPTKKNAILEVEWLQNENSRENKQTLPATWEGTLQIISILNRSFLRVCRSACITTKGIRIYLFIVGNINFTNHAITPTIA